MDTATVNWDFVVLFGTIMLWALLHYFSPDGKQWRTDHVPRTRPRDPAPVLEKVPSPRSRH